MLEVRTVDLTRTCHVRTGDPYTKSKLSIKRKCWGIFNKLDTKNKKLLIPGQQTFANSQRANRFRLWRSYSLYDSGSSLPLRHECIPRGMVVCK